jgi:hypothetical protein
MRALRLALVLGPLLLAGCGKQQHLAPAPGHHLPVKPATAAIQPTADKLLLAPPAYRPGRSDELLIKSMTRADDHFDLPPH